MAKKQSIFQSCLTVFMMLSLLFCPFRTPSSAADREDQLVQQRLLKLKKIEPEKQGMFEKFLLKMENKFGEESLGGKLGDSSGFSPRFGTIISGSGPAAGLRFGYDFFQVSGAYSVRGYQEFDAQVGLNPPMEGAILKGFYPRDAFRFRGEKPGPFLYADLRYRNFPQEDFSGIGPESLAIHRSDYRFEEASYLGIAGYQFGRLVRLDFRAGQLFQNIGTGTDPNLPNTQTVFNPIAAPGLSNEPDFVTFGSSFLLDYRDRPRNPHAGGAVGMLFLRYNDRGRSLYEFSRFNFDTRQFIPLGSSARVLALRFVASFTDVANDRLVPFYLMETLGGSHTLRGFPDFRFRDRHLMHLSAEYRFEAATWLELAAFYDAGKVFSRRSEFDFNDLQRAYGGGVRFKSSNGVLFRVDVGKSTEGVQVYLKLGSSF